jgi:hypothetical protein
MAAPGPAPSADRAGAAASAIRAPRPVVAVGLDFGTSGSGFAYAFLDTRSSGSSNVQSAGAEEGGVRGGGIGGGPPVVYPHKGWPEQPCGVRDAKTRTAVLYSGRQLVSLNMQWLHGSKLRPVRSRP